MTHKRSLMMDGDGYCPSRHTRNDEEEQPVAQEGGGQRGRFQPLQQRRERAFEDAGLEAVERDTLYNPVAREAATV